MPLRPTCFTASGTTTTYTTTTTPHPPKITSRKTKNSTTTMMTAATPPQRTLTTQTFRCGPPGLVRVALECRDSPELDLGSCPLRSVPSGRCCAGWKLGFAVQKKAIEPIRLMLKSMQSTTVGVGIIQSSGLDSGADNGGELMYMRANYECVVGRPDSESFHLINLDGCPGQEFKHLLFFLMRSQ